eukprot:scaffold3233_cov128-Skeletonema_marinoi.AAC.5
MSDASSGHLRRCSDADTIKKRLSREKDASILYCHVQLYDGPYPLNQAMSRQADEGTLVW